ARARRDRIRARLLAACRVSPGISPMDGKDSARVPAQLLASRLALRLVTSAADLLPAAATPCAAAQRAATFARMRKMIPAIWVAMCAGCAPDPVDAPAPEPEPPQVTPYVNGNGQYCGGFCYYGEAAYQVCRPNVTVDCHDRVVEYCHSHGMTF